MSTTAKKSGRGKTWIAPEVNRLLSAVERILPLGMKDWETVERDYNTELPREFAVRDWEAIKRRFFVMKNSPRPTGDPLCPPDIARAKCVYRLIEGRARVEDFDDGNVLYS